MTQPGIPVAGGLPHAGYQGKIFFLIATAGSQLFLVTKIKGAIFMNHSFVKIADRTSLA